MTSARYWPTDFPQHQQTPWSPSSDDGSLLLRRAKKGSREALDALFARCSRWLLALIRARVGRALGPHLEPVDVLQETLLRAFVHFDDFEGTSLGSLASWLAAIATNQIRSELQFLHRQRRDVAVTVSLEDEDLDCLAVLLESRTRRPGSGPELAPLLEALSRLDRGHREILLLRSYEGLSYREIGKRQGKSPDACRMLHARALLALRSRLAQNVRPPGQRGRGRPHTSSSELPV